MKPTIILACILWVSCSAPKSNEEEGKLGLPGENPASLSFEPPQALSSVLINSKKDIVIEIKAIGAEPLAALTIGTLFSPFSVAQHTCGETLAPNSGCAITVSFLPVEVDSYSASLLVSYQYRGVLVTRDISLTGESIAKGAFVQRQSPEGLNLVFPGETISRNLPFEYSGSLEISNFELIDKSYLTFAGGAFPGTEGSCPPVILAPCSLNLEVVIPTEPTLEGSLELDFKYQDGIGTTTQAMQIAYMAPSPSPSHNGSYLNSFPASFTQVVINGDQKIVLDQDAHRILIWNLPSDTFSEADTTIGQLNPRGTSPNLGTRLPGPSTLNHPASMSYEGSEFVVADTENHRILVWNTLPESSFQPADFVLGQLDFTSRQANLGGQMSSNSLSYPSSVQLIDQKLWVVDKGNSRITVYDTPIATNSPEASLILQNEGSLIEVSSKTMIHPGKILKAQDQFLIMDQALQRILVWEATPSESGDAPDWIIGQPDFTTVPTQSKTPTNNNFYHPCDMIVENDKLIISDSFWNRILVFQLPITQNQPEAISVIGQTDFLSGSVGNGLEGFSQPCSLVLDGEKFIVSEAGNSRATVRSTTSKANATAILLGEELNQTGSKNNAVDATTVGSVRSRIAGGKLILSDSHLHRVMVWNDPTTLASQDPDLIFGQSTESNHNPATTKSSLRKPLQSYLNENYFLVVDSENHRILGFPDIDSTTSDPTVLIGQSDFTSRTPGEGLNHLHSPSDICLNATHAFVLDKGNHRVLRFPLPLGISPTADLVLGHRMEDGPKENAESTIENEKQTPWFSRPEEMLCDEEKLIVADSGNDQVLIWSPIPDEQKAPSSIVKNFSKEFSEKFPGQASSLFLPKAMHSDATGFYLLDHGHNRILYWENTPANQDLPDWILGQSNTRGGALPDHMQNVSGFTVIGEEILLFELGRKHRYFLSKP